MRPLVFTTEAEERIKDVIAYAERERYPLEELKAMGAQLHKAGTNLNNQPSPRARIIGDDPGHLCVIPFGYRVCFSIEEQPPPLNWTRHISISVDAKGKWPNEFAVDEIAKRFGIRDGIRQQTRGATYIEDYCNAVNIIESMEL